MESRSRPRRRTYEQTLARRRLHRRLARGGLVVALAWLGWIAWRTWMA